MADQPSASWILERYAAGDRSFVDLDLDDKPYDFSEATLIGADFSGCFICANFRGANLERAVFRRANVKTCNFSDANLQGASFEGAAIDGAVFDRANLAGASFLGASDQGHVYKTGEMPFVP